MKIESMPKTGESYKFRVDDIIVLEIAGSMIPTLEITIPPAVRPTNTEEYRKRIREQFDIEKMINDLLDRNNKIKKVSIKKDVCFVDCKVVFQISELKKYKIKIES